MLFDLVSFTDGLFAVRLCKTDFYLFDLLNISWRRSLSNVELLPTANKLLQTTSFFVHLCAFTVLLSSYIARCYNWHTSLHDMNLLLAGNTWFKIIPWLIYNPSIMNLVLRNLDFTAVHRSHTAFGFLRTGDSILKIVPVYPPVFCWACALLWLSVPAHCFRIASVTFDFLKKIVSRWVFYLRGRGGHNTKARDGWYSKMERCKKKEVKPKEREGGRGGSGRVRNDRRGIWRG